MALRIVFCGTPAFAVPALEHLIAQPDIRIEGVVTQPDRPRGRGNEISISPVKAAALAAGIDVFQPEKVRALEIRERFGRTHLLRLENVNSRRKRRSLHRRNGNFVAAAARSVRLRYNSFDANVRLCD